MELSLNTLIDDILREPMTVMGYELSRRLAALFPDEGVLEGVAPIFNVQAFADAGLCALVPRTEPHGQWTTFWAGPGFGNMQRPQQAVFDVTWEGERMTLLIMHFADQNSQYHYYLMAREREIADRFHDAVCSFNTQVAEDELLVFDVNGWNKDEALFAAIKNATLDTLILAGSLKEIILHDLSQFFASRDTYAEYAVPWKRGVLFVGPAGNGKTHAIKALVNALGQTCIYVKTFGGGGPQDQMMIRTIFERARTTAPCIIVLEDLDSFITPSNRSYFLNELDGFAGNDGILTLATTNHPERLDPAIVDRPSRFDRKYPFDLPGGEERTRYIEQWNLSLRPALQLSAGGVERVALQTDGFSFAYLKELFLSATMRWIETGEHGAMDVIMSEQVPVLHNQMASIVELPSDPGYSMQGQMHGGMHGGMHHHRGGWGVHHPGPGDIPL
jgi:ATPase family associated with various cellular activities (AAA)